jgi:hypothetical protein
MFAFSSIMEHRRYEIGKHGGKEAKFLFFGLP